ncbi:MAG TPA: hypothetical protein PK076_04830 [Saprospiraceae bacterium]|nr:hypothetical protein [Saprospiraceae bacterium]
MEEMEEIVKTTLKTKQIRIVPPNSLEKKYLLSAITARLMAVGVKELKSLKLSIDYIKSLETTYTGMRSPFYFDKYIKTSGRYFWNPFLPIFYTTAFEKFLKSELYQTINGSTSQMPPGIAYLDFSSCHRSDYLTRVVESFGGPEFELPSDVYKVYVRWNTNLHSTYLLNKLLGKMRHSAELWLVAEAGNYNLDIELLKSNHVKGLIFNLPVDRLASASVQTKKSFYDQCQRLNQAGILIGLNTLLVDESEADLAFMLGKMQEMKAQFTVWNLQSGNRTSGQSDESFQSSVERFFLKANTQKAFSTAPIVFYPEFYKKISFTKNLRMRHFAHYTFRGEIKVSTILIRDLFKFFTIPVEPEAILKIA